jgi:hypothetical protein
MPGLTYRPPRLFCATAGNLRSTLHPFGWQFAWTTPRPVVNRTLAFPEGTGGTKRERPSPRGGRARQVDNFGADMVDTGAQVDNFGADVIDTGARVDDFGAEVIDRETVLHHPQTADGRADDAQPPRFHAAGNPG